MSISGTQNRHAGAELQQIVDMSQTQAPEAADATGAVPGEMTAITPDSLMAYCSSQIDDLDGQMQSIFNQQQTGNQAQQVLGNLVQELQAYQTNGIQNNTDQCQKLEEQIYGVYQKLQSVDPGAAAGVASLYNEVMASGSGPFTDASTGTAYAFIGQAPTQGHTEQDSTLDSGEVQGYVEQVQSLTSSINSNMQLGMINLQSLLSQRQSAIQLTTNMLQAIDDGTDKITANIGH